jgi:hypothetical protein
MGSLPALTEVITTDQFSGNGTVDHPLVLKMGQQLDSLQFGETTPLGLLGVTNQAEYCLRKNEDSFKLDNFGTNIFRIARKAESDPSQGYSLDFNGSIQTQDPPSVAHDQQFTGEGTSESLLRLKPDVQVDSLQLGDRSSEGFGEPSTSEFSLVTKNHKLLVNNYGGTIFELARKNEDDPSAGYDMIFNGSISYSCSPILGTLPDQPPYSNALCNFFHYNQHTGITQELRDWKEGWIVFGIRIADTTQKARVRDIFGCDIFNVEDNVVSERILDAVNAFSFWQVDGTVLPDIHMDKARLFNFNDGDLFWLGAVEACQFNRNGDHQVDLVVHKPYLPVLGGPALPTFQVGWSVFFTAQGGTYNIGHIPYLDIQPT